MASITTPFRTSPKSLPSAEVFFKCKEVYADDGYGVMTDSIRGASYNPLRGNSGQYFDNDNVQIPPGTPITGVAWMSNGSTPVNSVYPLNGVTVRLESGTWPNFAQRKLILFATGIFRVDASARVPFGNGSAPTPGTDGNFSISFAGRLHSTVRNENEGMLFAIADPEGMVCTNLKDKFVTVIGEYIPATTDGVTVTNGSMHVKITDESGNVHLADDGITPLEMNLVADTVGDVRSDIRNVTRIGGIDFYSAMVFSFTGDLPPAGVRDAAYAWMRTHHRAGHRELPPQFAGYV